jgi:IS1 family transposase
MHNEFTVFSRVVPSGKKVMYYHAYDENGKRVGPWTTGETSRTAARNYCVRLVREKRLIPNRSGIPIFAEYAKDWWDWEKCPYLKEGRKRFTLTRSYADSNRKLLRLQLMPYFFPPRDISVEI